MASKFPRNTVIFYLIFAIEIDRNLYENFSIKYFNMKKRQNFSMADPRQNGSINFTKFI